MTTETIASTPTAQLSAPTLPEAIERVLVTGDLSPLTAEQRVTFYTTLCRSLGINHLSKPFEYITLNNKLTLYARKDATDQLRRNYRVSITIVDRRTENGVHMVTARATTQDGRSDESIGAVGVLYQGKPLVGEALANCLMKAETKAKRRVTLSICGLGFLDETEVDDIVRSPDPASIQEPQQAGENFKIPEPIRELTGGKWKKVLKVKKDDFAEARIQIYADSQENDPLWRAAAASYIDQCRHIAHQSGNDEWVLAKAATDAGVIEWPGDLWIDPLAYPRLLTVADNLTQEPPAEPQ